MTEVNNSFTRATTDILTHQRDIVLFDFLARGLSLSHRPFNAVELNRDSLNVIETPVLWVMMDKQCDAPAQQKLVEYIQHGGRLILAGRIPEETFDHNPCTILKDAIAIQSSHSEPPFTQTSIQAFHYSDVPVSFLETYSGDLGEVFANSSEGKTVGFIKELGKGRVMVFGAALAANTLDDLDILEQMAQRMDCPRLFTMSDWLDVRLSEGENGSFLFINNYQDDPIETEIACAGLPLLGGHSLKLAARRGLFLPLEWQINQGILLHYISSEIIEVLDEGTRLTLKTEQNEFFAELSLNHYRCDSSLIVQELDKERFQLHGKNGLIELVGV